jgi:hypothetical protein
MPDIDLDKLTTQLKSYKKQYFPEGADSYDVNVLLPAVYEVLFDDCNPKVLNDKGRPMQNPCMSEFHRIYMWTALVWNHVTAGRACTMSNMCGLVEDLEFPDKIESPQLYDADGIPNIIFWKIRSDKGMHPNQAPYDLCIERNYLSPWCCPIMAIMQYLSQSNLDAGPLFPAMDRNNHDIPLEGVFNSEDCWCRYDHSSSCLHLKMSMVYKITTCFRWPLYVVSVIHRYMQ